MKQPRASLNNPALLTWARETAGLTVEALATAIYTTPRRLALSEAGEAQLTFRQLNRLATVTMRSVAVLYLPEVPMEPGQHDTLTTTAEVVNKALRMICVKWAIGHCQQYGLPDECREPAARRFYMAAITAAEERLQWAEEQQPWLTQH